MSNKYWIDKTDGVDTILAENFNSAFAGIESDIAQKANKFVETEISNINEKLEQKADKTSVDASLERIKYYGSADIIPSDESYFTVNGTGETITGLTETGHTQTELVIPYKINGVEITGIGGLAFSGRTSLTSITIPNSVTSIGTAAFGDCRLLKSINIPNSVTSIESDVFNGCTSLTSINIPNSVTSIEIATFYNCSALTSINIPNSVTSIAADAFVNCTNLTIYCEQGSYAETFAKINNIPVVYTDVSAIEFNGKADAIAMSVLKQRSIPHTKVSGYPISVTDHLEAEQVIDYKVYGNSTQETRSGKNLLPYPYSETTKTENGVTFTDNGDGTITVNGTATTDTTFILVSDLTLTAETYTFSGCPSGGSDTTYYVSGFTGTDKGSAFTITLSEDTTESLAITVKADTTISNKKFSPQIEVGSTATSYEQYGAMPSPEFPSEIQSVGDLVTDETSEYYGKYAVPIKVSGKNLLSKWYSNMHYSSCTKSKAIYMEPGTYNYHFDRVDDTVTKWRYAMSIFDVDGGENDRLTNVYSYLATFTTNGWYCNDYGIVQTSADVTYSGAANIKFTFLKPCYVMWMWQLKNSLGAILDAKKYAKNVMLEKGEQYTGYEDYIEPITANIYIDEPLRKVGDYADYIDYKNQKVFRQIEVLDDTGTKTIDESLGTLSTPIEESIIVPNLTTPNSALLNVSAETITSPSKIDLTYYQDINKKLAELQEAITALGGI